MLDNGTKRKIDNARNILVGKVPDPKSQVEQITIALIYKFMDDLDKQSEGWGGKATFFSGEYKKYSWSRMFDPKLGGFELINTYGEALIKMNQNPNIPQLFRDIFKNAYLPYRNPETLKSFLKEINEFKYDHSEQLGNAYEYLLSVLSSQGDAGQFRTPRHIIDFMIEIVRPEKKDTVLDPACGTAGFLISSYKHILTANTDKTPGDKLTPDERKRMLNNFIGYDISPDMVRLSLVNMYLHGFADPNIIEYDTLTSEERWNDTYDVMLANPPFMSPKGGIRPHKRFSIQAKRSEVLFVDYIAEHLNPNGRAGVIVPEGIIFQSQTAYKNLRKMLVENYLWAVVSLPVGIFNPYSGVKTSILLMDKGLAKKSDGILFVKIESDGYDLGAQRRAIDKNDLPGALAFMKDAYRAMLSGQIVKEVPFAHVVKKGKIAENVDWGLSGERYRILQSDLTSNYQMAKLGDICKIYQPKTITSKEIKNKGEYKVFGANGVIGYYDKFNHEDSEVLITCRGATCGTVNLSEPQSWITGNAMVVSPLGGRVNKKFLFYLLGGTELGSVVSGSAQPQITRASLSPFQIPLPSLEIQQAIVSEIDTYQKIIDGARQVVDNYKPSFKIEPDWEIVDFCDICTFAYGKGLPKAKRSNGDFAVVGSNGICGWHDEYLVEGPAIIVGRKGSAGEVNWIEGNCFPIDTTYFVKLLTIEYNLRFLYYLLKARNLQKYKDGAGIPGLNRNDVYSREKLPFPPLSVQKEIVSQIEKEQKLVNANKQLIEIYEQKIKDKIAEVWGE